MLILLALLLMVPVRILSDTRVRTVPNRGGLDSQRNARLGDERNGPWGHPIGHKANTSVRFGFLNINGLPAHDVDQKDKAVSDCMKEFSLDAIGMAELNLNFNVLRPPHQWKDRFRHLKTHRIHSFNTHSTSEETRLFGGTAILTSAVTNHRTIDHGTDDTGLGRWSWLRIRGKKDMITRIIVGYRPVPDNSHRVGTVFTQHQVHLWSINRFEDPREAFLHDLFQFTDSCIAAGESIILALDLNEDCRNPVIAQRFTDHSFIDCHASVHTNLTPVATCNKRLTQVSIDGIWVSAGMDITKSGMLGFGGTGNLRTDHRLLWVDIEMDSIFGYQTPPLSSIEIQNLPLNDPRLIQAYNKKLREFREYHNIPQKIFMLEQRAREQIFDERDAQCFFNIVAQDESYRKSLKTSLRKKYAGQVPYSDVIGLDRKAIQLWDLVLDRVTGRLHDTRKIRRLMEEVDEPFALRMSLEDVEKARKKRRYQYKQNKKKAQELRDQFQRKVNERRATKYNTTIEAQEKITRNAFKQKASYARIRRITGKSSKQGITYVEDTDDYDVTTAHFTKNDIEQACMREGFARYAQSQETPFFQEPLYSLLGPLGHQQVVSQILDGTFQCPHDVDEFTKKFIEELQRPHSINPDSISGEVSTHDHIQGWKHMKKTTASSPFGPSFTDYIAGSQDVKIAEVDAAIASIPALTGSCPPSWQKAVDVMIPKKTDSAHVKKLRIIVLFHALFNMFNKRVAKIAVKEAEACGIIPHEAYGSRKGYRATDCGLNKVLTLDIARQRHEPVILCSNDAKSCYDRIIHPVANICLQRLGVAPLTIAIMFATIQHMDHHIKTAYGLSETSYGSDDIPLQGVLQGNGAGPVIWLAVSIPLIQMLHRQGFGFRSKNPLTLLEYMVACYTFVDDTDLVNNSSTNPMELLSDMQRMINHWQGGLFATGGLLVPSKSYWYLVDFKWNEAKGTWQYKKNNDNPGTLVLHTPDGPERLKRVETNIANETLGIWIAADGNHKKQVEILQQKVQIWAGKIRTKQLSRSDAWKSLRMGISKSLRYPLAACALTKSECNAVERPLRKAALPALGFPPTFPLHLVHAPPSSLGLGIPSLWNEQGIDHINTLLRFGSKSTKHSTGQLLHDSLATLKIELGLPGNPTQYPYDRLAESTTRCTFHATWEFCYDHNLIIKDCLPSLRAPRTNDRCIMEVFLQASFSPKELRILNVCRLWCRCIYVSDLVSGDGKYLLPIAPRVPTTQPPTVHTHINWPKSGRPSQHFWTQWKTALNRSLVLPHNQYGCLKEPLTGWEQRPGPAWKDYYSPSSDSIFRSMEYGLWAQYRPRQRRRTRNPVYYLCLDNLDNIPEDSGPTTTTGTTGLQHTHCSPMQITTPPVTPKWWSQQVRGFHDIEEMLNGLIHGTAVCVTDGSFKETVGSAAFIMLPDLDSTNTFQGVNQTPGTPSTIDPYRAELGGIYACVAFINDLAHGYDLTDASITIGCDCSSALWNVFHKPVCNPQTSHFDLLAETRELVEQSPVTWKTHYVKGHQDQHTTYNNLDRWGQLNVDMDALAKSHWQEIVHQRRPAFCLPHSDTWSIWQHGIRLSKWDDQTANHAIFGRPSKKYWNRKLRLRQETPQIAWHVRGIAYTGCALFMRMWLLKWFSNRLPIGRKLQQWKISQHALCPRCGDDELALEHVLKCSHLEAKALWSKALDDLEHWMVTSGGQPELCAGIIIRLKEWATESPRTPFSAQWTGAEKAIQDQDAIGWARLFDGICPQSWVDTQHSYLLWIGRKRTGERWTALFIRKLWDTAWDLWKHRMKISTGDDSYSLMQNHILLDDRIQDRFTQFLHDPRPALARFFAVGFEQLAMESVDFKRQWLKTVDQGFQSQC